MKRASYFIDLGLDPARCRFTYRRVTLVGVFEVPAGRYAWSRPRETRDAVPAIVAGLQWTLQSLYGVRSPSSSGLDGVPLRRLSLSVREAVKTTPTPTKGSTP